MRPWSSAPAHPQQVADHTGDLDVGVLQRLLKAQAMLRDLPDELLPGAREVTDLLNRGRRHEAAADQAMGHQIRQPHRIVHVALAPRNRAHVRGVGEEEIDRRLQHVPHRLPIHARGLQRRHATAVLGQPIG